MLTEKVEKTAYHRVYVELYSRFSVSGYENLPTALYDTALAWLKALHEKIIGR